MITPREFKIQILAFAAFKNLNLTGPFEDTPIAGLNLPLIDSAYQVGHRETNDQDCLGCSRQFVRLS